MKKITAFGSLLIAILFIFFIFMPKLQADRDSQNNQTSIDSSEVELSETGGEVVEIGLMQQMAHPSLDLIRQGIYDGLAERGYVDGENIEIEYQNGQGDQNNFKMISDSFVAADKDILVGIATAAAQALANAAKNEVPVIMSAVSDPIGAGIIKDLEEPGVNITGVSDTTPIEQQIDLIVETLPEIETIGIIYNSSEVNVQNHVTQAKAYADSLGLNVEEATISSTNDLAQVAEQLAGNVDAVWVPNDNTIASAMPTLISATNSQGVPVFPVVDQMVAEGGIATVGLSQYQLGRDSATVIADVIEGADPATYPVKFTTAVDLYYNSDSAEALGIELPERVIEEGTDMAEGGEN